MDAAVDKPDELGGKGEDQEGGEGGEEGEDKDKKKKKKKKKGEKEEKKTKKPNKAMVKEMQQRLEQIKLEEERSKQEEEEKQRALEEAENRRLEKVFIFVLLSLYEEIKSSELRIGDLKISGSESGIYSFNV